MNLESLRTRYRLLNKEVSLTTQEKAKRGYALEQLLFDLFRSQGILMTRPFRISGEQIDGAFQYRGWTYLVEVKWQGKKKSTNALYAFQGKPDRRIEGTRGLFISMSGFYKTAVERFEKGRKPNTLLWTAEHIEAVLAGLTTIPELLDLSIRSAAERGKLLMPLNLLLASQDDSLFAAVLQACAGQVNSEIASLVGKRYIPQLYVPREQQRNIDEIIRPERYVQDLVSELRRLRLGVGVDSMPKDPQEQRDAFSNLLTSVRSCHGATSADGLLRRLLDELPRELNGRMHILTAPAGVGKTNLLCHLAKHYAQEQPTVFLTGRSGITERTSIRELIESKLNRYAIDPLPRELLFDRLIALVKRKGVALMIFLDAVNEHRDFDLLNTAIADFLSETRGEPVVVIASCRDVYWPFLETARWPERQWSKLELDLNVFSSGEFERAIQAYFDFYKISATLSWEVRNKLAHPLILRFFCEAYGDPSMTDSVELQEVPDIRLKGLFDDYLARKLDSIRYTAPSRRRTSREVEYFLFSLADEMRRMRAREVSRDQIPVLTKQADLESPESVYVAILGEDIILEEEPEEDTGRINVLFTYDEFMEYMIARSMIQECHPSDEQNVKELVSECRRGLKDFPSFVGVFEYLDIILREDFGLRLWEAISSSDLADFGEAIQRAIVKIGPQFLEEAEVRMLGQMVKCPLRDLRDSTVICLKAIARGDQYERQWRILAAEFLREVLIGEDDSSIRYKAGKCFEQDEIALLSQVTQDTARWWKNESQRVRNEVILFTDDDPDILKLIRFTFERAGFRHCYFEHSTTEAIRLARQISPSLIVTDLGKPMMDGFEMARTIKAIPALREVPILVCSARTLGDHLESSGLFCGYISKPFGVKEMVAEIAMLLIGRLEE